MKQAFTLIELSIVLVIIGLIVGGVLVGRDLIEAAQLRSLVTQVEKYNAAIGTFKLKYNCLAGDCATATRFFPADATCRVYGATSLSFRDYMSAPNGQTCNGDGSGAIYGPSTAYGEVYLFWQHLSLAGLIEGDFTGAPGKPGTTNTGGMYYYADLNVPGTKIPTSMFTMIYPKPATGWTGLTADHYFWLGNPGNNLTIYWEHWPTAVLTPQQARALDLKADDGLPRSGAIQSDQRNTSCYTGSPASYNNSLIDKRCSMLFQATL